MLADVPFEAAEDRTLGDVLIDATALPGRAIGCGYSFFLVLELTLSEVVLVKHLGDVLFLVVQLMLMRMRNRFLCL